jgi:hypothetical protein
MRPLLPLAALSFLAAGLLVHSGCDVSSANDVVRLTGRDFTGFYSNPNGAMVERNTGAPIASMNLRQLGDRLEGVDNNGQIFRGSLSETGDNAASFTLRGPTTAGTEGTISGTLTGAGTSGSLSGTWVEPTLIANVFATATLNPTQTNTTSNLSVSPAGPLSLTVGSSRSFTANGGSGTYTWTLNSSGLGNLSASTGRTVTYTATAAGNQSLNLSDGRASPVQVTITQSAATTTTN